MNLLKRLLNSAFGKAFLATAILGGFLLLAGVPSAKADYWNDCNRRVAYTDWHLHEAIVHFGYYSPQADYWRYQRHEAYEALERYRRYEWRERAWREREWREHEWREHRRYERYRYRYDDDDDD